MGNIHPDEKREDQKTYQCVRLNDHEPHTWYGMRNRWCPGVIAQPLAVDTVQCKRDDAHPEHRWDDVSRGFIKGIVRCPGIEEETRPAPAWAVDPAPLSDWRKQCPRETAHHDHEWGDEHWCPGVGAHHNTQIGKGGPHDPDRHAYRDGYVR